MNRSDIATYLDSALPGYRTEFLPKNATWDFVVDATLRTYGTDLVSPTIAAADEETVRQVAVYHALVLAERVAGSRVAVSVGNPSSSKQANQAFEQVRKLRMEQGKVIAAAGVTVPSGTAMQLVSLPVPYFELAYEGEL